MDYKRKPDRDFLSQAFKILYLNSDFSLRYKFKTQIDSSDLISEIIGRAMVVWITKILDPTLPNI